jgi:uncharacterized protein YajQ (UPF0234 family)
VRDVLTGKHGKRGVDVRCLEPGTVEKISGNKVKQPVRVRAGIDQELGKKIVRMLKDSKLKVQASIQADTVRVSGAKKDVLQDALALVRPSVTDFPPHFKNFRDCGRHPPLPRERSQARRRRRRLRRSPCRIS